MAGVNDHGKVSKLAKHGDRREVKYVSCVLRVVGTDAALAENDVLVTARHNVFGTHQPFLDGCRKATL